MVRASKRRSSDIDVSKIRIVEFSDDKSKRRDKRDEVKRKIKIKYF